MGCRPWGRTESDTTDATQQQQQQQVFISQGQIPRNGVAESYGKCIFNLKKITGGTRWQRSRWTWSTSLSMDTLGI